MYANNITPISRLVIEWIKTNAANNQALGAIAADQN